jgi:hypothetical protein
VCEIFKDGAERGVGTTEGCEALQLKLLVMNGFEEEDKVTKLYKPGNLKWSSSFMEAFF